jgi:hypothetical protein
MNLIRMFTIVAALSYTAASQTRAQEATSLDDLASKLKALREELVEFRLEIQMEKVVRLEGSLAAARDARRRLETEERSARQNIDALDRTLIAPDVSAEERTEAEIERSEMLENSLRRILSQRMEAERKETDSARELHIATEKLNELKGRNNTAQRAPQTARQALSER